MDTKMDNKIDTKMDNKMDTKMDNKMDTINILLNFLKGNISQLISIYKKHHLEEGKGILSLLLKENNIDVAYLSYNKLLINLQKELDTHINNHANTDDIIYFYLNDNNNSKIVEIDTSTII